MANEEVDVHICDRALFENLITEKGIRIRKVIYKKIMDRIKELSNGAVPSLYGFFVLTVDKSKYSSSYIGGMLDVNSTTVDTYKKILGFKSLTRKESVKRRNSQAATDKIYRANWKDHIVEMEQK